MCALLFLLLGANETPNVILSTTCSFRTSNKVSSFESGYIHFDNNNPYSASVLLVGIILLPGPITSLITQY